MAQRSSWNESTGQSLTMTRKVGPEWTIRPLTTGQDNMLLCKFNLLHLYSAEVKVARFCMFYYYAGTIGMTNLIYTVFVA